MTCRRHRQEDTCRRRRWLQDGERASAACPLSPFSGFLCSSSSPAGKGNPLLLPSPGARWELSVVFRFLYCGLTCLALKLIPWPLRPLCSPGSSQQLYPVSCAELTRSLQAPSWVSTSGQKRVPVSLLPQPATFLPAFFQTPGDSEGGGQCCMCPAGLGMG